MADDTGATLGATWRQCSDRTFKAIEDMGLDVNHYLKALVLVISADFADLHDITIFDSYA